MVWKPYGNQSSYEVHLQVVSKFIIPLATHLGSGIHTIQLRENASYNRGDESHYTIGP